MIMNKFDAPISQQEIDHLAAFLAQDFGYKTFDIDQLRGFLWAVAGSPVVVEPNELLEVIFNIDENEKPPANYTPFKNPTQAKDYLSLILRLHDEAIEQIIDEEFVWPTEYCIDVDGQESYNFRQWCSGFIYGYVWLEETWDDCLQQLVGDIAQDEDEQELFKQQFKLLAFALTYLSADAEGKQHFLDQFANSEGDSISHDKMPTVQDIQGQLLAYGILGYQIRQMVEPSSEPVRVEKIGRNDPCLCGSGKKYKKCCGA